LYRARGDCNFSQQQSDLDVNIDKHHTIQSSLDELAALIRDLMIASQHDNLVGISCIAVKLDEARSLLNSSQGESAYIDVLRAHSPMCQSVLSAKCLTFLAVV
jgi:hypothetical protein